MDIEEAIRCAPQAIYAKDFDDIWMKQFVILANEKGGTIFVGMERDGSRPGLSKEQIAAGIAYVETHLKEHVRLPLNLSFERFPAGKGKSILAVFVPPHPRFPIRYRTEEGEFVYARTTSTGVGNYLLDENIESHSFGGRRAVFEEQGTDVSLSQVSFHDLEQALGKPLTRDDLLSRGIIRDDDTLTGLGLLVVDDTPLDVACFALRRLNDDDPRAKGPKEVFQGNLFRQIEKAKEIFASLVHEGKVLTAELTIKPTLSYDPEGLLAAFIAFLAHRDYFVHPFFKSDAFPEDDLCISLHPSFVRFLVPGFFHGKRKNSSPFGDYLPDACRNPKLYALLKECGFLDDSSSTLKRARRFYLGCGQEHMPSFFAWHNHYRAIFYDLTRTFIVPGKAEDGEYSLLFLLPKKGKMGYAEPLLRLCLDEGKTAEEILDAFPNIAPANLRQDLLTPLLQSNLLEERDGRFHTRRENVLLYHRVPERVPLS